MPVQIVRQQVINELINDGKVAANAAIVESKLALNHATHSTANDPTADQKAALVGEGTPSGTNKYTTRIYVEAVAAGLRDPKDACRVASTANITTLAGLLTIDGKVLVAGDRVLVKNQTAKVDNGIYIAASGAWARSADADENAEVTQGLNVIIADGDTQQGTGWVLATPDPIVVGTTALEFVQFKAPDQLTASMGLVRVSNDLQVQGGEVETTAGVRTAIALGQTPVVSWALRVYYNGVLCRRVGATPGVGEYTWAGETVTLGFTAADGEWLYANFMY